MTKKIFLTLFLLSFLCPAVFADKFYGVGIAKYAVLETNFNFSPVREAPNSGAKRFTHLKKGVTLFADSQNSEFYKVDLGLNRPYWIEKRYVECEGVVPEKRVGEVNSVKFYQTRDSYLAKINLPVQTSYYTGQNQEGLEFLLYDVRVNDNLKVINRLNDGDVGIFWDKEGGKIFNLRVKEAKDGLKTLVIASKVPNPFGYEVLKKDNALIFKIRKPLKINSKKPLKGVKIALDAGHGGDEAGVRAGGFSEKDVNLEITKKLEKELKSRGAKTIMTRKKDKNTGLYERVEIANKKQADFLISIHQNSLPNPAEYKKRHGAGVYYYNKNAYALAASIEEGLVRETGLKKDGNGVFNASFALTRPTNPVSVLVECGYLIHPEERAKLTESGFQRRVAKGIADGVEEFLRGVK